MPEFNEKVASFVLVSDTLVKCEWHDCHTTHQRKPTYPKGGKVTRTNGYAQNWIAANLEPWKLRGPGKNPRATLPDFRNETPKAISAAIAAGKVHPEYLTQKHHLISINLFKDVTKLSKDAELIGYDANHKNNGMCLPNYVVDIVQHDLQCHRGSHTNALYNDKIKPMLRNLEKKSIHYCVMDVIGDASTQMTLMDDLNLISRRIEGKIKNWTFLLRKNALKERLESNSRFEQINTGN